MKTRNLEEMKCFTCPQFALKAVVLSEKGLIHNFNCIFKDKKVFKNWF